jgi:serine/threonine protein phosphatase 1
MRYLAIGDIHGCFTSLQALASSVQIRPDDIVITLGDYVDRGPQSAAVLDWLIDFERNSKLIALRGNHDIMMLQARGGGEAFDEWIKQGGDATLASYSPFGDTGRLSDVADPHWEFLEKHLRSSFEIETHFFVHANAYPDYPLDEQPDYMLYWERFGSPAPHESGKVMVCGHTSQKSGEILDLGHAICIDTWACGRGWLTCLDVISGHYWQANQRGQSRSGGLGDR